MLLKQLRKSKGLTQQEVASFIGISQNNYSYWENGKVKIDSASLKKLANFFNVTTDYLLRNEGKDITSPQTTPEIAKNIWLGTLTQVQQSLVQAILQLNEIQQLKAQAYLAGLLGY